MAKILLCISGGIAAYKSATLASILTRNLHEVKTVMSDSAVKFITPLTMKTITGNYVYQDMFDKNMSEDHTSLSVWADMAVIAPATANTIAKITHGFADNLLSTLILDFTGPVMIFPSMHSNMWNNESTQENIKTLTNRGYFIYGPEEGNLAGGKKGIGRMCEPESIFSKITGLISKNGF